MTSLEPLTQTQTQRRIVLIDFDWQDADLLPVLCKRPELSIRLVAGAQNDDPGIKVAELCGLPRTVDLGDLTREIFDLALVSERSTRRTQIEGLLRVLGTPCVTPESFLDGRETPEAAAPAIDTTLAVHAAALESALGGGSMNEIVDQALPDMTQDAAVRPPEATGHHHTAGPLVSNLEDFPSPEDRRGLEHALHGLMTDTGASAAELHAGRSGDVVVVAQVGEQDPLLKGLVDLALESEEPQVVKRLAGPDEGKAWGAWPFKAGKRQGVLAAAAIDPAEGWTMWERTVAELRSTWDLRDREQVQHAFPLVPERQPGWPPHDRASAPSWRSIAIAATGCASRSTVCPCRRCRTWSSSSATSCPRSCATPTASAARRSSRCWSSPPTRPARSRCCAAACARCSSACGATPGIPSPRTCRPRSRGCWRSPTMRPRSWRRSEPG